MLKLKVDILSDVWFMSDPHFNHKNLCRGVSNWTDSMLRTRDYNTLEEMNQAIVRNINVDVTENDHLFCLGDWSFGGIENVWNFRKQINCKNIYLILGNHDHHIENNRTLPNVKHNLITNKLETFPFADPTHNQFFTEVRAQDLFKWVGHYTRLNIRCKQDYDFVLCHFPIASWHDMNRNVIHLFGHLHLSEEQKLREGKAMDVGLDGNYLWPYSLAEILNVMKNQPIKNISFEFDHHENIES